MTLNEFILLTEDEKIFIVWRRAKIIAERKDNQFVLLLYQVSSFYVEVWYSYDLMHIHKVKSFNNTDELDPYLKQIDISELLYNT